MHRQVADADERLAWMIILATIPVGLVGLVADHETRVLFAKPVLAGVFLIVNGAILFAGERFRGRRSGARRRPRAEDHSAAGSARPPGPGRRTPRGSARCASRRCRSPSGPTSGWPRWATRRPCSIGTVQILALLAGISRDGIAMVAGLFGGLAREDAARFAFLLATPVILAAGLLELPKLTGPLGHGIHGQILVGSVLAGLGAYVSVRFLTRYFQTRSLTPFAIYCVIFGLFSVDLPVGQVACSSAQRSSPRERRPRERPRSLASRTVLRSRTAAGVTSAHSSSPQNSSACSRLSCRGGISRSSSSPVDWRTLVSFFSLAMFTSMSSDREFSPTIMPS